ncbi:sugar ABC transporter permease [Paenibacillus sp. CGMCC 1.16610]|uniref:Sugar ABC transporter permease n=2 Tax=Paenibacillus TaxID=44249 RepID=A0ABU6DQ21_9BACL|nr:MULTISPECIES: sugar ABC transporter permease [Paenibacillus]MBA2940292.1 sugar ABC transporter permease [Paenibacillus sp. CGMCC 1.16610]MCY9658064.1 sugar ABC transporter permease [Paenibacillus anseongense]MEB4798936.1 sugar ABC transporter permease [Paenibacillus chondroitinus]MVQ35469.1 ABC transporter permease subunit [Paenibacillus anseongense]
MKLILKRWEPYLLIAPAILILLAFFAYPLLQGLKLAFMHYILFEPNDIRFSGLENFKAIFMDNNIVRILWNSLLWVVLTVGLQFVLGFMLAQALNTKFKGKNIYQSVVFLPWAVSAFLIGMIFKWMFSEQNGLINYLLIKLGIIEKGISFLALPGISIFPIIIAMVWYGVPFFGIMLLAALQSVPKDIYESADIDGAGRWTKLFFVTIPFIKSTIILTVLLRVIWVFNSADLIYIMTNGGPANTSHNLSSYIFNQISYTTDFGQASALGVLMLIILILYTLIFLRATKYDDAGDF